MRDVQLAVFDLSIAGGAQASDWIDIGRFTRFAIHVGSGGEGTNLDLQVATPGGAVNLYADSSTQARLPIANYGGRVVGLGSIGDALAAVGTVRLLADTPQTGALSVRLFCT